MKNFISPNLKPRLKKPFDHNFEKELSSCSLLWIKRNNRC